MRVRVLLKHLINQNGGIIMNTEQRQQYVAVADNSQVETIFMVKATDCLNGKNKKYQPANKWNETRMQR